MNKALIFLLAIVSLVVVVSLKTLNSNADTLPSLSESVFGTTSYGVPFDDDDKAIFGKYEKYQRKQNELNTRALLGEHSSSESFDKFYVDYILFVEKHGEEIALGLSE